MIVFLVPRLRLNERPRLSKFETETNTHTIHFVGGLGASKVEDIIVIKENLEKIPVEVSASLDEDSEIVEV